MSWMYPRAHHVNCCRTLRQLSDLRLAIYELAVIAALSAVGTVIPQNKAMEYYVENYPDVDGSRVFGFVTWRLIGLFQFDHIYVAPYFLGLLALLGASLAACTTTRQWPMLRVARRYDAYGPPFQVLKPFLLTLQSPRLCAWAQQYHALPPHPSLPSWTHLASYLAACVTFC